MLERQFGEVSEWLKEHAWKVCIRQRIGGSNPPLTAILKKELVRKYGLFFHIKPPYRGDENTRPGFDNWRSQLDRRRACEESARRASAASQSPPHRHLKERAHTKVRAFFSHKATLEAEESPEKKTGIEFCDLLIALTNSMRSPLCLPEHYARNFSVAL